MYDYLSNAIVFESFKIRQSKEMAIVFKKCCNKLKISPEDTNVFVLDNKCSTVVQNTIKICKADIPPVPPHQHRRSAAEKAIKTVKSHLLSVLATCHKEFPITEWDRILP